MKLAWSTDPSGLPKSPGAYVLLLKIDAPAALPAARFQGSLAPGQYCYVGSARGPGGIRARCSRHLRHAKSKRWHIDWLTTVATDISVSPQLGRAECEILDHLIALPGISIPVAGFGSSDCRLCLAHLVRIERPADHQLFEQVLA
jgi:Uri superfamily endonuclease